MHDLTFISSRSPNIRSASWPSCASKAVQIGDPRDVVDGAIDIKTDYEATHGAVNEAAPKVFLKYFFVNTKTGEKSGEMMAMITLN